MTQIKLSIEEQAQINAITENARIRAIKTKAAAPRLQPIALPIQEKEQSEDYFIHSDIIEIQKQISLINEGLSTIKEEITIFKKWIVISICFSVIEAGVFLTIIAISALW